MAFCIFPLHQNWIWSKTRLGAVTQFIRNLLKWHYQSLVVNSTLLHYIVCRRYINYSAVGQWTAKYCEHLWTWTEPAWHDTQRKKNLVACVLGNDMMLNVLLYYVLTALLLIGLIASDIWVFSLYDLVNLSSPLTMLNVLSFSVNALFSKLGRSDNWVY